MWREQRGVSIGSLYQYFPDKAAILRTLAERFNAAGRQRLRRGRAGRSARLGGGLQRRVRRRLIDDATTQMFLAEPVMRDIWAGTQADKALVRHGRVAEGRVLTARCSARRWRAPSRGRPERHRRSELFSCISSKWPANC